MSGERKALFHLPGLFGFYELYSVFLPLYRAHREYFYDWCEIASLYGAPADCLWGGGRTGEGDADPREVLALAREYGISARLTFSNSLLRKEHLQDRRCRELCELLPDAAIINGDGAKQELLLEEGLPNVDAFVSLTGMDEENILMSIFASSQNVPTVISKINRPEMAALAERLNVDTVVSPRRYTAEALLRYARAVHNSMGSKVETLYQILDGSAEALEFTVTNDPKLVNIPLKELKLKPNLLIAGILRGRKPIIPGGSDVMLPDDRVVVVSAGQKLSAFTDILR